MKGFFLKCLVIESQGIPTELTALYKGRIKEKVNTCFHITILQHQKILTFMPAVLLFYQEHIFRKHKATWEH